MKKNIILSSAALLLLISGCENAAQHPDVTIYPAGHIITMNDSQPDAKAVAVKDNTIVGIGAQSALESNFRGAKIDRTFADKTLVPGLIDPHVHMVLAAMMYAKPFAPPWDVQTPTGIVKGLPDRDAFLARITEIEAENPGEAPFVIYGYHNLVHGDLTRQDLDAITTDRALIIWHFSGHDFYMNTNGLELASVTAGMASQMHGIDLDANGELSGRIYEQAAGRVMGTPEITKLFLGGGDIMNGFDGFEDMLAKNGVTSVADLGYGLFSTPLEDNYYKTLYDGRTKLFLVPEHRAFKREFGDGHIAKINALVDASKDTYPRVLPQIKLFSDAAFYSQTMRLTPPGYLAGQSKGTEGLWVIEPDDLAGIMRPYWDAGFDIRIHSNGDAAQDSTLSALAQMPSSNNRLVIEHAGLITPTHIDKAKTLNVGISAASHYVHYMGENYKEAIGERVQYITPLASTMTADLPSTLHSDAPLAPPSPLTAASVHVTRSTRQGGISTPREKLTKMQALKAVTLDAAWAMGMDDEIGSIEIGKRADFTVLEQNPLTITAKDWPSIGVWGVVLDGDPKPVSAP